MKCGKCGSDKQTILSTRPGLMNSIMRRRICQVCERVWTTREAVIEDTVRDFAEAQFVERKLLKRWRDEVKKP